MGNDLLANWMGMHALETRALFSIYTVTSVNNSRSGSLRQAIIRANAHNGSDSIHFNIKFGGITHSDAGANGLMNSPVITRINVGRTTYVSGTLNSKPNQTYHIDIYSQAVVTPIGNAQGEKLLGTIDVTTNSAGNATFDAHFHTPDALVSGTSVTATATDSAGDTSEFSSALESGYAYLKNGVLSVMGYDGDDFLDVYQAGDTLKVQRAKKFKFFAKADVKRIEMFGYGGNDIIGFDGASGDGYIVPGYINAGPGDDFLSGGAGNDTLTGGPGQNTLYAGDGDDRVNGGDDGDLIFGQGGADRIYGNGGDDTIDAGGGVDRVFGGDGNDSILGGGSNDKLYGQAGDDVLNGQDQSDLLDGGDGFDTAYEERADILNSIEEPQPTESLSNLPQ